MGTAESIADMVWDILVAAINGGELKTVERLTVDLPQAEKERAMDLALIAASEKLAESFDK